MAVTIFMKRIITNMTIGLGIASLSMGNNDYDKVKPNIIFIMADDLGYGDLGCYGQKKIQTPNIDKLAMDGMRFTQAYAGSCVCAPSRCSLMTGMHNGHNRIRDNFPPNVFLRPDDFTIAELIKQAGYQTGGIGKWGLGSPGSWGIPIQQGFDYWYGHLNQDQAHFYYPDYLWENDKVILLQEMELINGVGELKGNRGGENRFYTHDLFTKRAIQFIESNQSHPFFLYLAYTIPHYSDYPKDTPEHFIVPSDKPYTEKDWPQIAKNYAAMITRLDGDIGRIIELITELGLEDNTLIIFTSDNGPYQGISIPIEFFDSNGPFRGGKRDLYEGGIRIPFIVKWKDVIPKGVVNDMPIAFWDIMPTFADIIGYPSQIKTDGISFWPSLLGENVLLSGRVLYWDYGHVRGTYSRAIRYGDYKGIQYFTEKGRSFELYNLKDDPGEETDISAEKPQILPIIQNLMDEQYEYSEKFNTSQYFK